MSRIKYRSSYFVHLGIKLEEVCGEKTTFETISLTKEEKAKLTNENKIFAIKILLKWI